MAGLLGSLLGGAGYALDTPGALLRGGIGNIADLLTGEDRVGARATGRDLLERLGILGPNQEGADWGDAAGLAADVATDPLTYLLGTGLGAKALSGAGSLGSKIGGKVMGRVTPLAERAGGAVASRAGAIADRLAASPRYAKAADWVGAAANPRDTYGTARKYVTGLYDDAAGWAKPHIDAASPYVSDAYAKALDYGTAGANAAGRYRVASPILAALLGRDEEGPSEAEGDGDIDDLLRQIQPAVSSNRYLRGMDEGVNSLQYDEPDVGTVTIKRPRRRSR